VVHFFYILDIAIISVFLYFCIEWLKERSSRSALGGILLIAAVYICAHTFDMYLTSFLFQAGFTALIVALVVVFQMDIRRLFERLAARHPFENPLRRKTSPETADVLVQAAFALAEKSIGALIVLKGREALDMHIRAGTPLDGMVSMQIITNIFYPRSPGHDGAMVIEGNRVKGFGVYLPLSVKATRIGTGGTRHAAALGLAERSDALVIVVSEERGTVSVAWQGVLSVVDSPEKLRSRLAEFYAALSPDMRRKLRYVTSNPGTKILSVVLATALWFIFARHAESISRSFEAPIEFRKIPAGWIIEETQPPTARITLSGRERMFKNAENVLKISLTLDSLSEGVQNIAMLEDNVVRPAGLSVDKIAPASVRLRAYQTAEVQAPVKAQFGGRLPPKTRLVKARVEPERVKMLVRRAWGAIPDTIFTMPIGLSDIGQDTAVRVRLKLPAHARCIEPAQPEVRVVIDVEKEGK